MKGVLIIAILFVEVSVFAQSVFYEGLIYNNDSPAWEIAGLDQLPHDKNTDGQKHLRHYVQKSTSLLHEDKIILVSAMRYKDTESVSGFAINAYDEETGDEQWQYNITGIDQNIGVEAQFYALHDIYMEDGLLKLTIIHCDDFLFFDRPFEIDGLSRILYHYLDVNTGELLSVEDDNSQGTLNYYHEHPNQLYANDSGYLNVRYGTESLILQQLTKFGELLSSKSFPISEYSVSRHTGINHKAIYLLERIVENEDTMYQYSYKTHGDSPIMTKDISSSLRNEYELGQILSASSYVAFYEHGVRDLGVVKTVNDEPSSAVIFTWDGEFVMRVDPTYPGRHYDEFVVDYHPQLDTWLFIGTNRVPNTLDIHRINTDGSLELLYALDIEQFDHLLFAEGIKMLDNGDIIIAAAQTRYPYLQRRDPYFHFPIFMKITKEQLGLEVSTQDITTEEQAAAAVFDIYPQPATEHIQLRWQQDIGMSGSLMYQISDMRGQLIQSGSLDAGKNINISTLVSGQYLLQLRTDTRDLGVQSFVKM